MTAAPMIAVATRWRAGVVAVFAFNRDVFGQAHAVAEAQCATVDQGAANALHTVCFTGMHGDREELTGQVVECRSVVAGRESQFCTGDVESDHTVVAVTHRELGDLKRAVGVTHRGDELPDADPGAV